ncbi:hypothetical protein PR048_023183 [Dryococelus australis]|uniref:Uncharacterized protein n=1 Tax=Dryococelus australis TaxID=614101 RepID=A0ABQ9GTD9_9NEOP|nr:hypothetical protein PR048_023183 [Dryococelus australis]
MTTENSRSISPNENLDTAPCPKPSCTEEGNLTNQCAHCKGKEKDTEGLELHCLRCQERHVRCDTSQCTGELIFRPEQARDMEGVTYSCTVCHTAQTCTQAYSLPQETRPMGEEVLKIPEYAGKPQEDLQQFIEACKDEFTCTKLLKVLRITKAKAQ